MDILKIFVGFILLIFWQVAFGILLWTVSNHTIPENIFRISLIMSGYAGILTVSKLKLW